MPSAASRFTATSVPSSTVTMPSASPVTVRIVTVLADHGVPPYSHCLYDVLDPEALEMLVESGDPELVIQFTVEEVTITVFGDGELDVRVP